MSERLAWLIAIAAAGCACGVSTALHTRRLPVEDLSPREAAEPGTRFLELDGRTVAYREVGDGEQTILLLHCFAGRMQSWQALQERLGLRFRTLAIDLWGFGASSRLPSLHPDDWNRQVLGVMDQLHIANAVLVGHSMGGRIALACAVQQPERVRGIVLMGADGIELSRGYTRFWLLAHSPFVSTVQRYLVHHPEMFIKLMRETYPPDFPISRTLVRQYQQPLRVRGTAAAMRHLGHYYHGRNLTRLARHVARIDCPVLLLWGARDRNTPVESAVRLGERLRRSELIVLPHTCHLPHEERPARVAEHVRRFMEQLDGGT